MTPLLEFNYQYTHSQEDILGGVEACSINACSVRWVAFTHNSAGKA